MKKIMLSITAALLSACLLLAGCSSASPSTPAAPAATPAPAQTGTETAAPAEPATPAEPKQGGDLTVVLAQIGNNMDPMEANYTDTSIIMYHVYDRIIQINDNLEMEPDVATSWDQPDNTTIVFTIGDGYKFHNGEDMTIDDVVYSIERTANIARMASFTENVKSVSADGNKVTVTLNEPDSGFIRNFAEIIIVNKAYVEGNKETYANAPIGTGPFKVKDYTPGDKMVLEAWADYPFEKAKLDTISFKGIAELSAKYIAVESGDTHFANIDAKDMERAKSNPKVDLIEKVTTNTGFISMNTQQAPFDNVNVRKAIAHAYNKEGIASLAPGRSTIDSMFPSMFETYYSSPNTINYDLQKAKELLEAEGYNASNPLKFEAIIYSSSDPAMEAFQAELRSINVEMSIVNMEFGVFLEKMAGADYHLLSGSWNNTNGNPLGAFECYYTGSFGNMNISFYNNPRCDELFDKSKTTTSNEELIAYAKEIQDIAAAEVPIVPTISRNAYYVSVVELTGYDILTSSLVSFRNAYFK